MSPTVGSVGPGSRDGSGRFIAWLVLRRLLGAVGVLAAVSVVVFGFVHVAPGGPELAIAGPEATPEQLEQVRDSYHLDDPLLQQYWAFVSSAVRLDFGDSYLLHEPVTEVVWRAAVEVTVPLMLMTWIVSTVLGIVFGYGAARSRGGPMDRFVVGCTTVGASSPIFATSMFLSWLFGVELGWFPFLGLGDGGIDTLRHLVLPAATATIVVLASTTRLSRVKFAQVLDEDQVTFARARGLSDAYINLNIVLRNSAVHLVTWTGSLLVMLIGGLVIVEQVYGLPGIGTLLMQAIAARDIPVIQGVSLLIAVAVVTINLVVDLVCLALDPRMRRGLGTES